MFDALTAMLAEFLPHGVALTMTFLVQALILIVPLMLGVAYLTYAERKVIGYMQVRIGPNRVGPRGWLQPIADAVKLMFKEVIIPSQSNIYLFLVAPILAIAPAIAVWVVVPFDDGMVIADIDAGLLYILAIASIGVYGVVVSGWASNSKYAFLGALRASAQKISYEIAMGFAMVTVLMAAGSMNLTKIVEAQNGSMWDWYWIPLLPMFFVYFIAGVAETNRAPFDVAEGESEIVAGFHVEYSGMTFAVFFLAEYAMMILISILTAIMFMGGWLSPFQGMGFLDDMTAFIPGIFWLLLKTAILLFLFLWFRATFPRYRYDQIMRLGWKVFIPLTIVWVFVTGIMIHFNVGPWFA